MRKYHVIVNSQVVNTISAKCVADGEVKAGNWIVNTLGRKYEFRLQRTTNAMQPGGPRRSHLPQYMEPEVQFKVS